MNHTYKVPIIPQNLNRQETIVQVAEVLDHLSNVTEDIIARINTKIATCNKKTLNISERVDKLNRKITKLSGAKKATQVFSSCKYPASDINQPYVSIFNDAKPIELIRHKVKYKKFVTNDEPLEKLQIYHVKVKKSDDKKLINGLGDVPNDIECVNNLLLYNTGKNLYKNFVMSDALQVPHQIREIETPDTQIGAAPLSISERATLPRSTTQNYFYTPNLGEVPALDVPLDLPDLPGVADDLRFTVEMGPGIAPSAAATILPELPAIVESQREQAEPEVELPPPPIPLPDPPYPGPEPAPAGPEPPKVVQAPAVIPVKEPELPRPPSPVVMAPVTTEKETAPKKAALPQLDVRASLMEAIRKAGGSQKAKLKPTNDANKEEAPAKAITTGGDLMADLHAKLSMRRKGISGTKKQENGIDAGSALGRISAMIPPPSARETTDTNTEDEDWDD